MKLGKVIECEMKFPEEQPATHFACPTCGCIVSDCDYCWMECGPATCNKVIHRGADQVPCKLEPGHEGDCQ